MNYLTPSYHQMDWVVEGEGVGYCSTMYCMLLSRLLALQWGVSTTVWFCFTVPEREPESLNNLKLSPSLPNSLEGTDLSSVDAMMSAVMSVGKIAENGGNSQNIKSPSKSPAPNRIGRRNQV